jgi:transmembrane sensor
MLMPELERIWNLQSRKLTGEASTVEIAELDALLEQNPSIKSICDEMGLFWQQNPGNDNEFLEATYLVHLARLEEKGHHIGQTSAEHIEIQTKSAKPRRKLLWFGVPVILLAVTSLFFIFPGKKKPAIQELAASAPPKIEVSTKNGNRSKMQLPDGSQVWLNAGSQLHYDKSFGNNSREVYLTGEAFFDVVKNTEKPFIIHTISMKLRVLGTQFNVRCYANEETSEASLVHGSLEVYETKRAQKWLLKPNEKIIVYNRPLKTVLQNKVAVPGKESNPPLVTLKTLTYNKIDDTVSVETAWTKNRLAFKDESFENVARKMERWYDAEFEFKDEAKKNLMMYGTFTTETLEQALAALEFSFSFRYKIDKRKVYIY